MNAADLHPPTAQLPAPTADLPTPALLVDLGKVAANIRAMARLAAEAGVTLRPHFKTSKCLEVARMQLEAGVVGFTCATPAEVSVLVRDGVRDVLWAHQPVGAAKVAFAVAAARWGVSVALDSVEAARPLSAAATDAGVTVPYLIEVDTGLGRAGVDPEHVVGLADKLASLPGLALRGVFTHEGHLPRYVGDRTELHAAGRRVGDGIANVAAELRAADHVCDIVSVGSTPGADSAPFVPGVTEMRAGTYVFYDANQIALTSATLDQCALTVLARVVSAQRPDTVIIDAGLKAMSSDPSVTGSGFGLVQAVADAGEKTFRPLPSRDVTFRGANEEHGYLSTPVAEGSSPLLRVGDLVRIVPNHACGAVNMWNAMYVVEEDRAVTRSDVHARH